MGLAFRARIAIVPVSGHHEGAITCCKDLLRTDYKL